MFGSVMLFSQSQRLQLYEEFTGENCGPCASSNPALNTLLNANEDKVVAIKYQVNIPSGGTLYNQTSAETNPRRSYYSITSAPMGVHDGNVYQGHVANFNQTRINNEYLVASPFDMRVKHWLNASKDSVFVETVIKATQAISGANLVAHNVVIEREMHFATPPGSNGEKDFEGVMRKMLPGVSGTTLAANWAIGDSVVLNLTWPIASYVYDKNQLAIVAFVQDNTSKNVKQAAYSEPVFFLHLTDASPKVKNTALSSNVSFKIGMQNEGTSVETFSCVLTSNQPTGWTSNFVINGTPYTSAATFSLTASAIDSIVVNVTTGTTTGVGSYTLKCQSVTNPSTIYRKSSVYVISGVTDLVVSNTGAKGGTGPENATAWDSVFTSGLAYAGNTAGGKTTQDVLIAAFNDNAIGSINQIYYNVGWTFPAFSDELVNKLTAFLNGGGRLFISGQDIAWDTWDAAGNGTATTKTFFTNFLNASFVNDGVATSTTLNVNASDLVFTGTPSSPISTTFYGSGNLFPDEINAAGIGAPIFYYNSGTSKPAGIRATNGTYKVVYFSVGMEQLTNITVRNTILKLSHDWFHGTISSTAEFDNAMFSLGQNYPNPGNEYTVIPIYNSGNQNVILEISDLTGRIIYSRVIDSHTSNVIINTSQFNSGMYMYRLMIGEELMQAKPMQVIH